MNPMVCSCETSSPSTPRTRVPAGTEPPEVLVSWSCHEVPVFTHDKVSEDTAA